MKRIAAVLALSLFVLPACSSLGAVGTATTGTISQTAPDTINTAKRVLTAAHEAHRTVADFLVIAATSNLCHATCAATAKIYLDQSYAALQAADAAAALSDAPGVEAKIATATDLIAKVNALVGKN
jgi:hypothetical protein